MQYIFDFDHTLYATEKFVIDGVPYKKDGFYVTPAIWDVLDAKSYFYDDVMPFMQTHHKKDMRLLTAMTPALGPEARQFQKVKVERSGIMEFLTDVVYMEGDKGPYLQEMYTGELTVFVDDKIEHLVSARKHCPELVVVQMMRPGLEDILSQDATIPVITTLEELDATVKQI